MVIVIVKL